MPGPDKPGAPAPIRGSRRDRAIAQRVIAWFSSAARELPWRGTGRNGYAALVSEAMLQQTQVSRVVVYFERFMGRFPTVHALAAASEAEVLAHWAGLGYYRRARNLHRAAQEIVARFGGEVPGEVEALRSLPGVGPYTAGAIASIAFGVAAPIVDGNVHRVLARLTLNRTTKADPDQEWAWVTAGRLVRAAPDPAAFNEGLMELGATICLPAPAAPRCGECPLSRICLARRAGVEATIPAPKVRSTTTAVFATTVVVKDSAGRVLLRRRPAKGMWGGLLECPTVERRDRFATVAEIKTATGCGAGTEKGEFEFQTTHRRFRFRVLLARPVKRQVSSRPRADRDDHWVAIADLASAALSSAQRRVLRLALGELGTEP